MKKIIIIVLILILLMLLVGPAQRSYQFVEGAKTKMVMKSLIQASDSLQKYGTFTNDSPQFCDIQLCSERYTVGGIEYQCTLAAKSPFFRGRGFYAMTTNDIVIWIDKKQRANP
jgi:hypothetical protein